MFNTAGAARCYCHLKIKQTCRHMGTASNGKKSWPAGEAPPADRSWLGMESNSLPTHWGNIVTLVGHCLVSAVVMTVAFEIAGPSLLVVTTIVAANLFRVVGRYIETQAKRRAEWRLAETTAVLQLSTGASTPKISRKEEKSLLYDSPVTDWVYQAECIVLADARRARDAVLRERTQQEDEEKVNGCASCGHNMYIHFSRPAPTKNEEMYGCDHVSFDGVCCPCTGMRLGWTAVKTQDSQWPARRAELEAEGWGPWLEWMERE